MQSTKGKFTNAMIAILTIIALTAGNFMFMGKEVLAMASQMSLNNQTEDTLNKNVKFDTFFKQGNENTHYLIYDVKEDSKQMYMNISVKNGYLKNATIAFEGANYIVNELAGDLSVVQDMQDGKISLKQIDSNSSYSIIAIIGAKIENEISLSELDKDSKVIFTATHVNTNGDEKEVRKEVSVNVKMKQDMEIELTQSLNSYFTFSVDGKDKVLIKLDAKLNSKQENNNLPIKETTFTVDAPMLNGIAPDSVTIIPMSTEMTNGQKDQNVVYLNEQISYNKQEQTYSIKIENKEVNGKIHTANGKDEYSIIYVYDKKAVATKDIPEFVANMNANVKLYTADGEETVESNLKKGIKLNDEV